LIGFVIIFLANVILLSLINAILGSSYDECAEIIDEKCIKYQNRLNLRNEAL
jgi:hypothetical protein